MCASVVWSASAACTHTVEERYRVSVSHLAAVDAAAAAAADAELMTIMMTVLPKVLVVLWQAVFTCNPYLQIQIYVCKLEIFVNQLQVNEVQLMVSANNYWYS